MNDPLEGFQEHVAKLHELQADLTEIGDMLTRCPYTANKNSFLLNDTTRLVNRGGPDDR